MRRKVFVVAALAVCLFMLTAASCPTTMKDWPPKKKAIWANGLYIKQWDSYNTTIATAAGVDPIVYMDMVSSDDPTMRAQAEEITKNANLTEEQRKVLRVQKKALKSMEAALDLYEIAITTGQQPSPALEARLLGLSNQLEAWLLAQDW